jgi:hypothetical protein
VQPSLGAYAFGFTGSSPVVVTDDGALLCFRQTKYAVDDVIVAPVGGSLDPGQKPLVSPDLGLA